MNFELCNFLDIGTGTGLLALMLAQQTTAYIDAVELERPDCLQARDNFEQSAWSQRLNAILTNIKQYQTASRYHLIISNPPFFENSLKPATAGKQRAKHDTHLTLQELYTETLRLLAPDGYFAVLLPFYRKQEALHLAEQAGFYPFYITNVRQTPGHDFFRTMLFLARSETAVRQSEIIIQEKGAYTPAFTGLLKDFYLYL